MADVTPASWDDIITSIARKNQIDPRLALAVAQTESSMNPAAVSPMGARGLMQLMPETAKRHNVNPDDPVDNIRGGVEELRDLLAQHKGDVVMALRRYNGGPNASDAATEPYVQKVLGRLKPAPPTATVSPGSRPDTRVGAAPPQPPLQRDAMGRPTPPKGFDDQHPYLAELADTITDAPWNKDYAMDPRTAIAREGIKFGKEALQSLDPRNIWKGLSGLPATAWEMVKQDAQGRSIVRQLWDANRPVRAHAEELMDQGHTAAGVTQWAAGMVPLVGPRIAEGADLLRQGEYARGAGALTDVGVQLEGPRHMSGELAVAGHPVGRLFRPRLTPEQAAAVQLGTEAGVPIDVATASGSRFARNIQAGTEATPIGGAVHEAVSRTRQGALNELADNLATQVHPQAVNTYEAGAGVNTAVENFIRDQHATADASYDTLRQIEASTPPVQVQVGTQPAPFYPPGQPGTPIMGAMRLPADLRGAKALLQPILDRYTQLIGQAQAAASPGLAAMREIVNGPDFMPASQLDANLSVIKGLGRGADLPQLRNVSQGLAARAVQELEVAHDAAIAQAGPAAQRALQTGRAATAAKYAAQEVFDALKEEPVGTFRGATAGGDAAIEHLRELARLAPQEVPRIGRAVLEQIFDRARGLEQGWGRAQGVASMWERLGPQTRQLLFGNRAPDLDQFFLLQRMLAEQANPSRTALVGTSIGSLTAVAASPFWGTLGVLGAGGIAALMNSRAGVQLLTQGLRIAPGTAEAMAWTANVARMIGNQGDEVGAAPPTAPTRVGTPPPPR